MTSTRTDASQFAALALEGLVKARSDSLLAVDGGVVLRARQEDHVAVVVGGGSGHYPAFAGMVGPGLASAAVCGDIFASPSSGQVFRVSQGAEAGDGVLLMYGNYMGDVLNFSHAQEKLRAQGLDVRTIRVTDDVVSAPHSERGNRRGVAGDLFVFKIAGASAWRGDSLDQVESLATRANEAIYTFGVAFDGCTLPGSKDPLFRVPPEKMSLGLGVHGEPGIGEVDLPTPQELARLLVARLVEEPQPLPGKKITVLLNGLGTMKYEELLGVYSSVEQELKNLGFEIVLPEVGELVTSLDMNGCSLSIAWLDAELEELWRAECDSPGFTRVKPLPPTSSHVAPSHEDSAGQEKFIEPSNSAEFAPLIRASFRDIAAEMAGAETELGELDSHTGDGDHGIGMARGSRGASEAVESLLAAGSVELLSAAAEGWSEVGGGTSGAIWGILIGSIATSLSQQGAISPGTVADALRYASENVQQVGGARVGDKTLVDALVPFEERFSALCTEGKSLVECWNDAAQFAHEHAVATSELTPRIGRAKTHGEKGVGRPDAGAISLAMVAVRVGKTLQEHGGK